MLFGMLLYNVLEYINFWPHAQAQDNFEHKCSGPMYRLEERQIKALEKIATTLEKIERKR
jgi:hypothetical protein